jgi:hypothetical protein
VTGRTSAVVLVCRHEEWEEAQAQGREPVGVPFPASDVQAVSRIMPQASQPDDRDERVPLAALDPVKALKALLAVDPTPSR